MMSLFIYGLESVQNCQNWIVSMFLCLFYVIVSFRVSDTVMYLLLWCWVLFFNYGPK